MSPKELVLTALDVLAAWSDKRKPAPSDIQILKEAFPSLVHLPVDELCCQIIHDLRGRAFQEVRPVDHPIVDDVA